MRAYARRPGRLLALIGLLALSLISAGRPASALTVVPLTLEDMERLATDVFVGTVVSTRTAWDADHRTIETRVRIRVDQGVKGPARRRVTVVVPGGVVGDVGMRVPGAPVFTVGERVLMLAEATQSGRLRTLGFFQGKMRVKRDAARGVDVVEAPGPAWGSRGQTIPHGVMPEAKPLALDLDEVVRRLGGAR